MKKKKKKLRKFYLLFSDTEDRKKSLNSRETINKLIDLNIIPIINENDTVATDELKFGDNDRLLLGLLKLLMQISFLIE